MYGYWEFNLPGFDECYILVNEKMTSDKRINHNVVGLILILLPRQGSVEEGSELRQSEVYRKFRYKILKLNHQVWSELYEAVMLWQCQCVSSSLRSQLSFIPVIGSHHKKISQKLTESWCQQWATIPVRSERNHWGGEPLGITSHCLSPCTDCVWY